MPTPVNLDALIPREDFEVNDEGNSPVQTQTLQVRNFERDDFFYGSIRKPDFQRQTSDWTPEKVCSFIESFVSGDLIPALIFWKGGGGKVFLIDGAHRLSALIAWVNDDYGDGDISKNFFEAMIPSEQTKAAIRTRELVERRVGSYQNHKLGKDYPAKVRVDIAERAKRLGGYFISLQWVQGDAKKAEDSFFKINQSAVPIDKTELRLLKARKLPNALAARAIIRSGTGHKYWSSFAPEMQERIEWEAKEINDLLFNPEIKEPIKTLDLPLAGKGYSSTTLTLVFDMVNLLNDNRGDKDKDIPPDVDGSATIRYLERCKTILNRLTGTHASSLGLHPVVYFYSVNGRYQPTAFFAILLLLLDLEKRKLFKEFTRVRRRFEDYILKNKSFVSQLAIKSGSGMGGGSQKLFSLFRFVLSMLIEGKIDSEVEAAVKDPQNGFQFLLTPDLSEQEYGKDFSKESKSAVYIRSALSGGVRCAICTCLVHEKSISIDHRVRKQDGGIGSPENGQVAHLFCNTGYKN